MLESGVDAVKRYAPPQQRNRVLNRRKSGERLDRTNYSFGNAPAPDHGNVNGSNLQNENLQPGLIPMDGCGSSEAARLLSERFQQHDNYHFLITFAGWAAAMHAYNDPTIDLSERPVMYAGASGVAWGHPKLPHQMDFLSELQRAIRNANIDPMPVAADHN
ncbi:hypothetical protein QJS10_CPA06g01516 [Acorus calamus]|uniref:Uncharacterized protein n=1 Tax=Acorus calamus TaxID=4465 RepID=A0AAV9EPD6_ACOCL|nr:hypothetical protein QJS10_CPA06g01516 [Acorus calamus]